MGTTQWNSVDKHSWASTHPHVDAPQPGKESQGCFHKKEYKEKGKQFIWPGEIIQKGREGKHNENSREEGRRVWHTREGEMFRKKVYKEKDLFERQREGVKKEAQTCTRGEERRIAEGCAL